MQPTILNTKKPLTLEDVAKEIGVSRSTVSAAFTGNGNITAARREAVRSAAIKLGYRPNPHAQRLANGEQNKSIALVTAHLSQDVSVRKLQILQQILSSKGYNAAVHVLGDVILSDETLQAVTVEQLRRMRPLAIIWNQWAMNEAAYNELDHFRKEGGVVVHYDAPIDLQCDQVIFDREYDGYIAMRHLLELGHREVGFAVPRGDQWRIHGIRKAMNEFNAPMRSTWLDVHAPKEGRYEEEGARLAEHFLAQVPRPTAISIVNDYVSMGFVAALQRRGLRVPEDVSIVTHNDTLAAKWGVNVRLTAVSQPLEEIAEKTADLLIDRLTGGYIGSPRVVNVRGKLSVRESTMPLNKRCESTFGASQLRDASVN